jgi:hypothetical protein
LPDAHWFAPVHAWPLARLVLHAPVSQKLPVVHAVSDAQLVAHAPLLHEAYGAHVLAPRGVPLTAVHVPTAPLSAHPWQLPAHAVLQHTPSTQFIDRHREPQSPPAVHSFAGPVAQLDPVAAGAKTSAVDKNVLLPTAPAAKSARPPLSATDPPP